MIIDIGLDESHHDRDDFVGGDDFHHLLAINNEIIFLNGFEEDTAQIFDDGATVLCSHGVLGFDFADD